VASASTVTGTADALVQVFASDMRHFEHVLERIAGEPFVERTKSVLVPSPLLRRYSAGAPGRAAGRRRITPPDPVRNTPGPPFRALFRPLPVAAPVRWV
jgi:hypothetical protein